MVGDKTLQERLESFLVEMRLMGKVMNNIDIVKLLGEIERVVLGVDASSHGIPKPQERDCGDGERMGNHSLSN